MLLGFGGGIAFNPMLLAGAAAIVAATQLRSPGGRRLRTPTRIPWLTAPARGACSPDRAGSAPNLVVGR